LQEKRLSSLTQDAPGLQNDHGSCDGGPVSYLESYQLTGLAIPDMPLHPDCLQEDLTSPTQKTAPSKARLSITDLTKILLWVYVQRLKSYTSVPRLSLCRLHKDLSLTMAEGCPSSQHDQVLCDKGPTSCLEYMGKILPETHSCHDYEQEDSRSSTTTSRATRPGHFPFHHYVYAASSWLASSKTFNLETSKLPLLIQTLWSFFGMGQIATEEIFSSNARCSKSTE
jgi:hypothetical protein